MIGDQALEAPILFLEGPQALGLAGLQAALLAAPTMEGGLGDPVPATDLLDRPPGLDFVQDPDDLVGGE
ncbi:MAG: hypothetical protein SFU84_15045 [Gemmatimonadales bacterium]|nr:hypothetical protein [Gemmatimonadales bacterium]